jgi:dihydroorotase
VKLYPAGATTNSEFGVTSLERVDMALAAMAEVGLPLLVHGEVTDSAVDLFDRESVFIETILKPLIAKHPQLRVVMEHITTEGHTLLRTFVNFHLYWSLTFLYLMQQTLSNLLSLLGRI